MSRKQMIAIEKHFMQQWENPPKPFNPDFDPKAKDRSSKVTASMEQDFFYDNHTREECRLEYLRRYDLLKEGGQ